MSEITINFQQEAAQIYFSLVLSTGPNRYQNHHQSNHFFCIVYVDRPVQSLYETLVVTLLSFLKVIYK